MPWWLIALWLLAMIAITAWSYRQFSDKIGRSYRLFMLACGLVALLAAALSGASFTTLSKIVLARTWSFSRMESIPQR